VKESVMADTKRKFYRTLFGIGVTASLGTMLAVSGFGISWSRIAPGPLRPVTALPARIEPNRTETFAAQYPGTVEAVFFASKQRVGAGDLLVRIRVPELDAELERCRVRLRYAEHRLADASGAEPHGASAQLQRARLETPLRNREMARERLAAFSIDDIQKKVDAATDRLHRLRALAAEHLATDLELSDAEQRLETERESLKSGRELRSRLKQELDNAEAEVRVIQMEPGAAAGPQLATAQADFADAQAAFDLVAHKRSQVGEIRASWQGTVVSVSVKAGDPVASGTGLLQIADLAQLDVDVAADATLAHRVREKQPVRVKLPTEPPLWIDAQVSSVGAAPESSSSPYRIRITIPNPSPTAILAGLDGMVEFPHGVRR
jgi:multidrug efflux pump subunit AcrA (membrane-fusion protein)